MKAKPLYVVIQSHPIRGDNMLRPSLKFEHHEVFACRWGWLTRFYAWLNGGSVEQHSTLMLQYTKDESGRWVPTILEG
jgi:hypothetical protein